MIFDNEVKLFHGGGVEDADALQRARGCSHMHGVGKIDRGGRKDAEHDVGVALL